MNDHQSDSFAPIGAALAGFAVILGAFGAHGLEEMLDSPEKQAWWDTAAFYQTTQALGLLVLGLGPGAGQTWRRIAGIAFILGILIFSGTLYAMALGGPRWLGAITPIGGSALILAWSLFAGALLRGRRS
jgi:uncharacterized membrane protein YgdD (TMEM256/DUF423 family)